MSGRYLLGSRGRLDFAIEADKYTKETTGFQEFGYTPDEIDVPNENPHTPLPTGGESGPVLNSPDQREHEIPVTSVPTDENPPLQTVLGAVETGEDLDAGYNFWKFTEDRPLPTMTVRHVQEDADLVAYYVGAKSNLDVTASQDEHVNFDYTITAARQEFDPEESAPELSTDLETDLTPYRFEMLGTVEMTDPDNDSLIKEVATITSIDLSWDNGLEANHHGRGDSDDPEEGREAYSVSEETNAERYDWSMDIKVTDTELYERAAQNEAPVNVEIPIGRVVDTGTITDGIIIRGFDCDVTDAPMPNQAEGSLEATIGILPLSSEIEIRREIA